MDILSKTEKIIRVAIYARVSTEEQKENFSLASQLELLRKHASDSKFQVHDEYVDGGYSGTSYERPNFKRLMEDSMLGKFELILVYKVDRFFRKNKDLLNIVDELQRFNVSIRSITEPFDTSNYLGKFVLSLFGSIAELERNTFLHRSKDGRLRRAKEGYYSGASPTRFGYSYDPETGKISVKESEAHVVRLVFSYYNEPDSSIVKVTRKLRALGYKTKEGLSMRDDVVHDILRDTIYIGKWFANRYDSKTGKLKPQSDWILVNVPAIVSEEDFQKAQHYLVQRRNYSERNAKYKYLLQGMVKCGDCGNTVAGTADKQIQIKGGKKYGPYFKLYYRCTHFVKNKFEKLIACKLRYVQGPRLEDSVWNAVEKIFRNPHLIELAVQSQDEVKGTDKNAVETELRKIAVMQESAVREEQRILEAYRQEIISIEQLKDQMKTLRDNKEALENTRQDFKAKLTDTDKRTEIKQAVDYLEKVKLGMGKFTYETKKQILKLLSTAVKVNVNGVVDIDCFLPKTPSPMEQEFLSCFASARSIF